MTAGNHACFKLVETTTTNVKKNKNKFINALEDKFARSFT